MNTREKNKNEMFGKVSGFYDTEKTTFAGLPGLAAAFNDITAIHKEINLNQKVVMGGTDGKVNSKDVSQDKLILTALVFAGAIYGYAVGKEDVELTNFADLNSKSFGKLRDSEVPLVAEKILDKADELGEKLIPFGTTEEARTAARTKLNDYIEKFGSLDRGKGSKKSARDMITLLFAKADKKLKVLDRLMLSFKESNPELFSRFTTSRMIYDKSATHKGGEDNTPPQDGTTPPAQ